MDGQKIAAPTDLAVTLPSRTCTRGCTCFISLRIVRIWRHFVACKLTIRSNDWTILFASNEIRTPVRFEPIRLESRKFGRGIGDEERILIILDKGEFINLTKVVKTTTKISLREMQCRLAIFLGIFVARILPGDGNFMKHLQSFWRT